MLDRGLVETALGGADWLEAAAMLASTPLVDRSEDERWRIRSMAACARVMAQGATGRDAAVQVRELVRLSDGNLTLSEQLMACIADQSLPEFALSSHQVGVGRVLLELSFANPVFDLVPDLSWALPIDPGLRRHTHPEVASSFLRRLSPHDRFASDGQKAALHALAAMPDGATLVVALPTGWGKSALFQIGLRRWREFDPKACAVVIVPTVALAQDHARTLATMPGLSGSRALVGGMNSHETECILEGFLAGEVPILLLGPEMAFGRAYTALCEVAVLGHLAAIIIDEAHIIASWGRHFRPDFQRLPGLVLKLRASNPHLRMLLLSATIDEKLRQWLQEDFSGAGPTETIVVPEPREEFDLAWQHCSLGSDRDALVIQAIDLIPRPAIIYTTTVEDAERMHSRLWDRGYRRLALFTGDQDDADDRKQILEAWANGTTDLIVATSAFGMGVDKANVRAIVHACLPESADRLYQEIGRGGRDGHQALSLCLWTNGDAILSASLAIRGWMRPETSTTRWAAILREADAKQYFSHDREDMLQIGVPLDARHDGLEQVTGEQNRNWNAALLTLLQRTGALRIVGEDLAPEGGKRWIVQILHPELADRSTGLDQRIAPFLTIGVGEAAAARAKAEELERAMLNLAEECSRTLLFDLVEPSGSPWPCGRCSVCEAVGLQPRTSPNLHEFNLPWPYEAWVRPCPLGSGAQVVIPEDPRLLPHLDRLVGRLVRNGIEQFFATQDLLEPLEQSICTLNPDLGLTLLLGGTLRPARVPTAVLIGGASADPEKVRDQCLELRKHFETHWQELALLFVLSPDVGGVGAALSQHLALRAPIAEQQLSFLERPV